MSRLTMGSSVAGPMATADTFSDSVARITAREKSRIILASEDEQSVSKETQNQGVGSSELLLPHLAHFL